MLGRRGSSGTWRKVLRCAECERKVTFYEKMNSDGVCPYCGHLKEGMVMDCTETAEEDTAHVAWTIWKLKVVRLLLKPLLRLHIWWETRHQRKVMPAHTEGSIGREAIEQAVDRVKKGRRADGL